MQRNLINYVVNYPKFQKVLSKVRWTPDERYWNLFLLLKRAMQQKVILPEMVSTFPKWLLNLIVKTSKSESKFTLFNEEYNATTAPKEILNDYLDSIAERVPRAQPQRLYPAMELVRDILEPSESEEEMYLEFSEILQAGKLWNRSELQACWRVFRCAFTKEEPEIFWNFLEDVINTSKESADEKLEGPISSGRAFAENLLSLRKDRNSFEVRQRRPDLVWDLVGKCKGGSVFSKDLGWIAIAAMGGLSKDEIPIEDQIEEDELILHGTDIDKSDLSEMSIISGEDEEL
jgi:hypothetical protein